MRSSAARGIVFVLSAPSGTGKSTVVRRLLRRVPGLVRTISWTTRPPRPGERDGRDYRFVDDMAFLACVRRRGFVEWNRVVGSLYGTPLVELEKMRRMRQDVICVIDVQGGSALRRRVRDAVLIFLAPPSLQVLEARLRGRGGASESEIQERLRAGRLELQAAARYEYRLANREVGETVDRLCCIIEAERCRTRRVVKQIG